MEKIQAAIAKARAARGSTTDPAEPGRTAAARPAVTGLMTDARREELWAQLSEFRPDPERLERQRIVAMSGGREANPFDVLRTKLLQQMRANNWRRLAITSPSAACGKSTITLNLGLSLARQPEVHTVIGEMDLRRPSLSTILGVKPPVGFGRVLEGRAPFEQSAVRIGANLAIAVNDGPVRNPAELLQSASVPAVIEDIEKRYAPDLMLFDLPPMLVSDDAMAFMGQVDCVLLVAAAETTTIKEVDICESELASQTNVLGVILNKCRYMGPEYGYGYYG